MRLAWLTDPHLNHVDLGAWDRLITEIQDAASDALLLTGDISEGEDVFFQLGRLAAACAQPIYFVLGNHDFYFSSIHQVRQRCQAMSAASTQIHYLLAADPIELVPAGSPGSVQSVALVGDDGWGDATVGDFDRTPVRLADFDLIHDFVGLEVAERRELLAQYGRQSAERLAPRLEAALQHYECVVVLTHVPPFREACWYEGKTTDDLWAPFFVCGALGQLLRQAAERFPQRQIVVLCGHTHHAGQATLAPNLRVLTGPACYGQPALSGVLEIPGRGAIRWVP